MARSRSRGPQNRGRRRSAGHRQKQSLSEINHPPEQGDQAAKIFERYIWICPLLSSLLIVIGYGDRRLVGWWSMLSWSVYIISAALILRFYIPDVDSFCSRSTHCLITTLAIFSAFWTETPLRSLPIFSVIGLFVAEILVRCTRQTMAWIDRTFGRGSDCMGRPAHVPRNVA